MAKVSGRMIRKVGGYDVGSYTYVPALIVGAGESGVPLLRNKCWEKSSPLLNTYMPGFGKLVRYTVAIIAEYDWRLFGSGEHSTKERKNLEAQLVAHMKRVAPHEYHGILTPDHSLGCKRRVFDGSWLDCLHNPAIELTTLPLKSIGESTVTLGPRRAHHDSKNTEGFASSQEITVPADVKILANGFQTTTWLHPLKIIGRNGKVLHDVFASRGGPSMYMGMALDGFPNFFTIFSPNTATGHTSVILASENMVNMSLKLIGPIMNGDVVETEITTAAQLAWDQDTQGALKKTVWNTGGCRSWYKTADGWNSTLYPYSQIWFGLHCMFPTWSDWQITYTSKGLVKKWTKTIVKLVTYAAVFYVFVRFRKSGQSLNDVLQRYVRHGLLTGSAILQLAASKV